MKLNQKLYIILKNKKITSEQVLFLYLDPKYTNHHFHRKLKYIILHYIIFELQDVYVPLENDKDETFHFLVYKYIFQNMN